ncbi:MarR family transcriptional regulator [Streptomyces sp. BHT-5-2]|uniref:MarR family winged helix-turn-helix transcriptional regulator n=1 Tax=unclassified Streptomyces TaxID=2593676 RepID=UPI001C8D3971|nr:MarR family transcriptional regulator [Streptomyces sp. BHT-5-2]QZL04607.1 MarR family transcriptional regulator [Streptomyces sp. BHT-5-2]
MRPSRDDVARLAFAVNAVAAGVERARRRIPEAASLAVLQVLGWAEREAPDKAVRPSDLASALEVHRSAITHQLKALQQAGHVTLTTDPADRRSSIVTLTASGRHELDRLAEQGLDRFTAFVADWDAADVRTLAELLTRFEESKAKVGNPHLDR